MDDQLRPVYEKLYRSYRRPSEVLSRLSGDSFQAAKMVTEIIEQVQGELKDRNLPPLREDAKYFLLLGFVEMVYVPLSKEENIPGGRPQLYELREGFREDVRTIAYAAAEEAKREEENLVSSHKVIDTLHNSWDRLNSAVARVWEKRRRS